MSAPAWFAPPRAIERASRRCAARAACRRPVIAIVHGSPSYSAYLRTSREWAAVYLSTVNQQQQRALHLLEDIDACLGKRAR